MPLICDWPTNQPRQKVCFDTGKAALTHYEVLYIPRSRLKRPPRLAATALVKIMLTAGLRAALHHAGELIKLAAADAQLFGDDIQHLPLVGIQLTIRAGRLGFEFQKHMDKIETAKADLTKLAQPVAQRAIAIFPLAEASCSALFSA